MVLQHAAAKLALKASEDSCACRQLVTESVSQSGFLQKLVVVMSDAHRGSMDDSGDESGPHARGEQLVTPPVTAGRSRAQRGVTRKLSAVSKSDATTNELCSVNPSLDLRAQPYFNFC